jgi:hypothetical protein
LNIKWKRRGRGERLIWTCSHKRYSAEAGKSKTHQFIVGFSLETENLLENANVSSTKKLRFDCCQFGKCSRQWIWRW